MRRRVALYLCPPPDVPATEERERALRAFADRMGLEVTRTYIDRLGCDPYPRRSGFRTMRLDAARGHFDTIMAWSVDQLGRSLQDFVAFLGELHALDMDLIVHEQGINTTATTGQAVHQLMGALAAFGRAKGRDRATLVPTTGSPLRTKQGRPQIPATVEIAIEADLRTNNGGIHAIAKRHGVGVGTVQRIKAALA